MNKPDLIQALKDLNHLSISEAERIVALFFDKMADALAQGERVEIRINHMPNFSIDNSID